MFALIFIRCSETSCIYPQCLDGTSAVEGGTLKKCSPRVYRFLGKPQRQCKDVNFVGFLKDFASAAISTIAKTPKRKAYIYIAFLFAISGMWMERSFDYHLNDGLGITYDPVTGTAPSMQHSCMHHPCNHSVRTPGQQDNQIGNTTSIISGPLTCPYTYSDIVTSGDAGE